MSKLPPVLTDPPWLREAEENRPAPEKDPVVVPGLAPPTDRRIVWAPGEREEWAASRSYGEFDEDDWDKTVDKYVSGAMTYPPTQAALFARAPEHLMRPLLRDWRPDVTWHFAHSLKPIVARFEMDARDVAFPLAKRNAYGTGAALLPYLDAEVARLMADWRHRLKSAQDLTRAWFGRHGVAAVPLLVPDALGRPRAARRDAGVALRLIASSHGDDAVVTAAGTHGDAVADLLAREDVVKGPKERPASPPKIKWADPAQPPRSAWVLTQLGLLGDDETVRRLTPVIRAWPGHSGHAKAVQGLGVLAAIGTDVALIHLHGIARTVRYHGLRDAAERTIGEVAARRGLTAEQLADRLVPAFGLDAPGGLVLDYGPRRFAVGFDEQLKPYVVDGDGRRRKDLPQPGVKDDPDLAPAAKKRFAALKKDVRAVAADQIGRLESAMVVSRRWMTAEFRDFFLDHPLMWHVARRLVWMSDDCTAFRIAEDRTLADAGDDAFTLRESARVGVAHPVRLGEARKAWAELFADYEITQPFPQLGRPVHALTEQERASGRLARFKDVTVPVGALLGLTRSGWEHGTPQDNGTEHWITRTVAGGCVVLNLDPGIQAGYADLHPEQRLDRVWLGHGPGPGWQGHEPRRRFGELDAVTASEILADLTRLTGSAIS